MLGGFDWTSVELKPYRPVMLATLPIPFWLNQCGIETNMICLILNYQQKFWLNQCGIETRNFERFNIVWKEFWLNQCGIETCFRVMHTHTDTRFWLNQCGIETSLLSLSLSLLCVLIEPVWNWNNKVFRGFFRFFPVLIEPVWNWNKIGSHVFPLKKSCFDWTSVELKPFRNCSL